jgi:hypothetical protein
LPKLPSGVTGPLNAAATALGGPLGFFGALGFIIRKALGFASPKWLTGSEQSKALGQTVRYNAIEPSVYRSFGFPGAEDKTIYVWLEAVLGYVSAAIEWASSSCCPSPGRDLPSDSTPAPGSGMRNRLASEAPCADACEDTMLVATGPEPRVRLSPASLVLFTMSEKHAGALQPSCPGLSPSSESSLPLRPIADLSTVLLI